MKEKLKAKEDRRNKKKWKRKWKIDGITSY